MCDLKKKVDIQVKKVYGRITGNYYTNFTMCKVA